MTHKVPRKPGVAGYYRGVVATLVALYAYEGAISATYAMLASCFPLSELLHSAKRDGFLRASGLSKYAKHLGE